MPSSVQDLILEEEGEEVVRNPAENSTLAVSVVEYPQVPQEPHVLDDQIVDNPINFEQQDIPPNEAAIVQPEAAPEIVPLRRSERVHSFVISDDYVSFIQEVEPENFCTYLQEVDFDIGEDNDPVTYNQANNSSQSTLWTEAMHEVWDLVEPNLDVKPIGCKCVFKTKRNADGSIERYRIKFSVPHCGLDVTSC
ncbi:hypothetical protein ACLB2K_006425 [Fragaria x ananassa]